MDRLISCKFNMDTACVELKFFDGSMIAIDTIAVENEVADNMYQRSELDYLIYNDPIGYVELSQDEFVERMQAYQTKLQEYFNEGSKLQEEIMEQLKKVKYE